MDMYGQEAEHLTFKGIPIDGPLDAFVEKLEGLGYKYLYEENCIALMDGTFAGFAGCCVGVSTIKGKNIVYLVGVRFPTCGDWSTLEKDYTYLKTMLIKKYGEPERIVEEFTGCVQPKDNVEKLHELYMDRCVWGTSFRIKNGDIILSLHKSLNGNGCYAMLKYFDEVNTSLVDSLAIDDL